MVWACIPTYHMVREDWAGDSISTNMKEEITQAIIGKSQDNYCEDCGHYTSPKWRNRVECECSCHKE